MQTPISAAIARHWNHLREFIREEWIKVPIGASIGLACAIAKQLVIDDEVFRNAISNKWTALTHYPVFRGVEAYQPLLAMFAGVVAITLILKVSPFILKGLKSWILGVVSGLLLCWATSFFVFFSINHLFLFQQLRYALLAAILLSFTSFIFRVHAIYRSSQVPHLSFAIPKKSTKTQKHDLSSLDADNPIETWDDDVLERSALVESLASTVIVSKAAVVSVQGKFGDGKSSVLNLLKRTLQPHAIVVTFSTWLPGSEQTLTLDLFNDIASECKKRYYMPQLRRSLLGYAKTICGTVSLLKPATDLLPSVSQRDEIEELAKYLSRIPRRIVVLLDEIDRLQEEELRVLLKILRGVALFPNLSYVCAFDQVVLEKKLFSKQDSESRTYFEKFFPVTFAVPKPDVALLFRVLQSRLNAVFDQMEWFHTKEERQQFNKKLAEMWDETLAQVCTNLRKVALIVNDVSRAARPLVREVNALDLVNLEILRRFFPTVYEVVWKNQTRFVESEMSWKTAFYPEEKIKRERAAFFESLKTILAETGQSKEAGDLLLASFPSYAEYQSGAAWVRQKANANLEAAEKEKRIFHPDFFPRYFRYQVPETMFSETELEKFITTINALTSHQECVNYFSETFREIPKESPRRLDFLHRLELSVNSFKDLQAEALVRAVALHAAEYVYDIILITAAEAGRALAIIFEVAQRFAKSAKIQDILESAISESTDDTFALRLLVFSTQSNRNKILTDFSNVNADALKDIFAKRMERRYGAGADISQVKLAQGDREAFVVWAQRSEKTREVETQFWRNFINGSRKRLAQTVDFIFPHNVMWESDPTPHVDLLFPMSEVKTLLETLPSEEPLDENETKALDRLEKLINGEFKHGVAPVGVSL